jgi:hypothetical protein
MIKMLGKGYGLISQAFFVEKMLIHFKDGGVWEKIYTDYIAGGTKYRQLPIFMKSYLSAIKEAYSSAWPQKVMRDENAVYSAFNYDFILCKSTGMGAMFRLIREFYPLVSQMDEQSMKRKISDILGKLSQAEATNLFSKDGIYGGAGSEGSQVKLYRTLKSKLGL